MAGMSPSVRIEGMDELVRALRKVSDAATTQSVLHGILMDAAEPMRDEASRKAPVGTEPVTRPRLYEGIRKADSEGERGTERGVWVKIAPLREVAHANLQEFGTRHHAAQPFMRPAFDAKQADVVARVRSDLKAAIERAVR